VGVFEFGSRKRNERLRISSLLLPIYCASCIINFLSLTSISRGVSSLTFHSMNIPKGHIGNNFFSYQSMKVISRNSALTELRQIIRL